MLRMFFFLAHLVHARAEVRKGKHIVSQCMSGEGKNLLESNVKDFREQMSGSAATAAGRLLAFVEDNEAGSKATKVMMAELPKTWDTTCLLEDDVINNVAKSMEGGKEALANYKGLWLYGSKKENVFAGCDAQSAPTLRVQATILVLFLRALRFAFKTVTA